MNPDIKRGASPPRRLKIVIVQIIGRGGTQLYTSQLFNSLRKKNELDVDLILGDYLYNYNMFPDDTNHIHKFHAAPSYWFMILQIFNPLNYLSILNYINKEKPSVVHLVFEDFFSTCLILVFHFKNVKIVFTEHNPKLHEGEKFLVWLNQSLSKLILRGISDKIVVHGNILKDIVVESGTPSDKVIVIPHGDYSYYTRWGSCRSSDAKRVLFFGMISPYKGLRYLIDAEPIISREIEDYKFVIAGSGDFSEYADLIKDPTKFEIHNKFIPDQDVARYFENASVVVLPYIDASQSGVVPIAYAFGIPVIASNVGSIPEVVIDNVTGLIVPPKDVQALADAIIKVLKNDHLREEMGNNAYKMMQENLSWDRNADLLNKVYSDVIRGSR